MNRQAKIFLRLGSHPKKSISCVNEKNNKMTRYDNAFEALRCTLHLEKEPIERNII